MAGIADALVSAIMEQLISIPCEEIKQQVRLVVGVTKEVEKLSDTFMTIQAVLKDADKRQVKEETVNLWLEKLRSIAYDTDDVLDEWNTEILKSKLERPENAHVGMFKKVRTITLFSACLCFKQVGIRHDIGRKIKDIRVRLDLISGEKDKFHFNIESSSRKTDEEIERPTTSSQVDDSKIFGRESDKETIVSKLLCESSHQGIGHQVPIVCIVGMGGLGKTTLAQLVYNDEVVKTQFPKRMWVCVSDPFDRVRIAKAIIKEAADQDRDKAALQNRDEAAHQNLDGDEWNTLHRKLSNSVEGKLFLLVLDDVWTKDYLEWEPFMDSLNRGAKGSRIVVTTRNKEVANMMGAKGPHTLKGLSNEDCWSLLKRLAFIEWTEEECTKFEDIGREIANKCKGLPLYAKIIGSLLRSKKSKDDWKDVLESDTWELPEVEDKVKPVLLLSYNNLPSHLKCCFAYCAIFPKDRDIQKDVLIKMWMAQGFLKSSSTGERRDLEKIGSDYFDNLVMRSFLNPTYGNNVHFCNMHDLVHDLAQFLTKNECSIMEIKSSAQELPCSNPRHLTLLWNKEDISSAFPPSIHKAKNLRTLQATGWHSSINALPPGLFQHLTCLRVLYLKFCKIEELPSEIDRLIHLRYIDLSFSSLKELPDTISNLHNLQTLNLDECSDLHQLPEGLGRLINLRHLMLDSTSSLLYLPQGIGRLSSLRTLNKFIVGGGSLDRGLKIGDLKDLKLLQGKLRISGLERVENESEAKKAELQRKQYLHFLKLIFDGSNGEDTVDERMESVLESLQPHPDLKILKIKKYSGSKLPNWMVSELMLSNLVDLQLIDCKNCKQLPPTLGKLSSLEILRLTGMDEIKYIIGSEFSGVIGASYGGDDGGVETIFPKLEFLSIEDMYNLEELDLGIKEAVDGRKIILMPRLHSFTVERCHKIKSLTRHLSPSIPIKSLRINDCPELTWTPPSCCLLMPHLEQLYLWGDAGELSRSLAPNNHICHLSNLKELGIYGSTYSTLPKGLALLTTLQMLEINSCGSLMSLPEEMQHLTTLRQLEISDCPALEPRCQKEVGEDWSKISHIPNILIDDQKI